MSTHRSLLMFAVLFPSIIAPVSALHGAGFLRVQEQDIVDESGRKVMLRGVGLGNWMLPEGYMWKFGEAGDRPRKIEKLISDMVGPERALQFWRQFRRDYITEADIRRIAELGFNSVRPALNSRLFLAEGEDARWIDEGFELLDRVVAWSRQHGLYVIIDMHGAPGGQTGANIDDSPDDQPRLFMEAKNQDRLVELWVKIATRYKDDPTVAAYDLLNEPLPQRTGAAEKHKAQLEPLYRRITRAIREVDTKHMITLEGADWSNDWSVFGEPFDPNTFYQFHYYCWDRPSNLNGIERFIEQRSKLNRPVWVGETGEKDNTIYWATTQYFEANNIGWSFWPWKKMDTTNTPYSIKPPQGWDAIRAYSRGEAKPSPEAARRSLDQLLINVRLENCVFFPDVVYAILRRVPGKVEAENYGHDGAGKSYSVKDPSQRAKTYRKSEPVPIELTRTGDGGWRSDQAIQLRAEEWTAYAVGSRDARAYDLTIRVKAEQAPAAFRIVVNDQAQEVPVSGTDWTELKLKPARMSAGENRIRLVVDRGIVQFDYLLFR